MLRFFFLCWILVIPVGCGVDRPETVPVRGRITLDGGQWPADGGIYFTAIESAEGFPRRPARADFDRSGRFEATTWHSGDGLMPGRYKVHVECWKTPPEIDKPLPENYVPPKYRSPTTSDLELTVSADSRGESPSWDIHQRP